MKPADFESHLSRIETRWSLVFQAGRGESSAGSATAALMERYGGAVRRYLLASLRDPDAADELAQEFAIRFLQGKFKNAAPHKGRFRDYVKRSIRHLMIDYHRSRRVRAQRSVKEDPPDVAEEDWSAQFDRRFDAGWRDELLAKAWAGLAQFQELSGKPAYTILRVRVDHPDLDSQALAERLSETLEKKVDANWVRVNLHRSRDRFVELLIDETAATLSDPSPESLERELIELDLYERCRPVLRRRGKDS